MIEIESNITEIQAEFQRLIDASTDPGPAFIDIGEYLVRSTKQRFTTGESPDGVPWAPNTPTTLARKKGTKPLIGESKRLSSEINYDVLQDSVEVGSPMVYAAVQQFGAKMGEFGRYSQVARYSKYGEKDFRRYAGTKKGFPLPWGDIPARPFLGISPVDAINIVDIIREHISGAIKA